MGYGTPIFAFNGHHAQNGMPSEKSVFGNGDHYEYGRFKTRTTYGMFYCRWKTVGLDSGLKIYKTESGAKNKFESEKQAHKWTKEQRHQMSYISANASEHRSACGRYR